MADELNDDGVFSVRCGRPGNPNRAAVEALMKLGDAAKPVPAKRNEMVLLAIREYVQRNGKRKAK
jgi:hypothetical protein